MMNAQTLKKAALVAAMAGSLFLTGCATNKERTYAFDDGSIRSVLVVPVVSESTQVGSDVLMFSASTTPIAEKGYYPFPVETVKLVLEQEGLYEPEQVQQMRPERLAGMFEADSVLFIRVLEWDAQYAVFDTVVKVLAQYKLFRKDGTELWSDKIQYAYNVNQNQSQGGGLFVLLAKAITAAVARAAPDFRPAAFAVNNHAVRDWKMGPLLVDKAKAEVAQAQATESK